MNHRQRSSERMPLIVIKRRSDKNMLWQTLAEKIWTDDFQVVENKSRPRVYHERLSVSKIRSSILRQSRVLFPLREELSQEYRF